MTTLIPKFDLMNGGTTPTGAVNRAINFKLADFISVKDFGAFGDGSTDDTTAIKNALSYCSSLSNGCTLFFPTGKYKCSSGITINTGTTSVDFCGSTLDFTSLTSGNAISIVTTITDGNIQNANNYAHPIQNGILYAADGSLPVTAFYFDSTGFVAGSGGSVKNVSCINFATDVYFNNGAFCIEFEHCNFQQIYNSGSMTTYSIVAPNASNAGERNSFIGCMWNNRNLVLNHTNFNANMFFIDCSFDYATRIMTITAGAVYLQSCHIENSSTTDYLFSVVNTNSVLCLTGCDIITQSARTIPPFYSDSTCTLGGVCIDNCRSTGAYTFPLLVDGTGKTVIRNVMQSVIFGASTASAYQNYLAYGDFENSNYTGEWTLTGGTVRSAAKAYTGSYSLSFPASVSQTPGASVTLPMQANQVFAGQFYFQFNNASGTGATFFVVYNFLNSGGNSLFTGAALSQTTEVNTWTLLTLGPQIRTPIGTAKIQIGISIYGTSSGTPTAYIDNVIFNVY